MVSKGLHPWRLSTMAEIKRANSAVGQRFFHPDKIGFWNMKVVTPLIDKAYFVVSMQGPGEPVRYVVCQVELEGKWRAFVRYLTSHRTLDDALAKLNLPVLESA